MTTFRMSQSNAREFMTELAAIRTNMEAANQEGENIRHFRKIESWGRIGTALGYATAWIPFNPFAFLGIAFGMSTRSMVIAHHSLHGAFDRDPAAPQRYKSRYFGRGLRRWLDWPDWLLPKAWKREHNGLHHYRLGECDDPDLPERNLTLLRNLPLPHAIKYLIFCALGLVWKAVYYGPNVLLQSTPGYNIAPKGFNILSSYIWDPRHPVARRVWLESWLPYVTVRYGLMPLPFLILGAWAWTAVLINTLIAELITNFHCYFVIIPNHGGEDLPRFDTPARTEEERLLRQIAGSVNYTCGSDWHDCIHGWLNYQIEHHIWPDLSPREYRLVQPAVKNLCLRFGVPYRQEPVQLRFAKLAANVIGSKDMWRTPALVEAEG